MDQSLNALCDALKKLIAQLKPQHNALAFTLLTGRRNQGKATLLRQSHFDIYPVQADGAHIYYNQTGIVLELGESWLNQSKHLLQYTLKQLNRCHRSLKINGLLLCVDINELLISATTDIKSLVQAHAQFMERFGIALGYPIDVAILFTKLDLLTGFCDFFQNEHALDLQKPLGFSLHECAQVSKLPDVFKTQFDYLIETLGQQVINKIHPVRSGVKRTLIREFPLQFGSLRNFILLLISGLSPKLFRLQALYFTSGEQGGVSMDRLNKKIQHEYALTLQNQFNQATNHRAYFITGALHAFQTQTKRQAPQTSFARQWAAGLLIGGTVLGVAWIGHQYITSARLLDTASKELIAYDSLGKAGDTLDSATFHLSKASGALNAISSSGLLMPTVQTLKMQLSMTTKQHLSGNFLPSVLQEIEQAIADSRLSQLERYQALKVYLMLGEPEHFSEKEVIAWFQQHWKLDSQKTDANKKLALLTQILHKSLNKFTINKQIVTDARNFLNALPTSYLYYSLAKANFSRDSIPVKLNGFVLSTDKIPAYLTKPGFQAVITQLPSIIDAFKAENWILARQDLNELPILLQQAYCYEYVIWWQHFMQEAHPVHVQNYEQAFQLMQTLRQNNTINALIDTIQKQTSPNSNAESTLFNQEIASKFSELNLISNSTIDHLVTTLNELEKFLSTLSVVHDQGKTAFMITKSRFQGDILTNPLSELYTQSHQLPEPIASWAKQIGDDSWFTLINNSRTYINQQWQQQVYHDYQTTIANRYPFDTAQTDEISINDFNRFFSTHGNLNRFVEDYLKPFLDTSKPQWQLKEMNNYVLPISSDMINELIRANVITNMFFPDQSDTSQIEFSLQKVSLDPIVASLQLTIGDTKLKDTQTSDSFTEFHWPQSNARLVVNSIEGQQFEIDELGTWAFFKILQKVNVLVDEQDSANLQILFEINGNSGRYLLKAQNQMNPFIPGILNEFTLTDSIV
ncbi:MAG: type IVB secretion system protein IcmF [Legionellaceae bacterium]|nr:type IVB secretion system protein IcmF [Legionellaceae bacterium]